MENLEDLGEEGHILLKWSLNICTGFHMAKNKNKRQVVVSI
jgi:hypothetical protein